MDIISLINSSIFFFKSVISPTLERNIYTKFVRVHNQHFETKPSYFILMIMAIISLLAANIISTGIFHQKFQIGSILTVFGALIGFKLITSQLLVLAVSCEIVNHLCEKQDQSSLSKFEVLKIVDCFKELSTVAQPYIFLNFSLLVCNLIVNLYMCVLFITGCSPALVR